MRFEVAEATPEQTLLVARLVAAALIFGLVSFAGVVWTITDPADRDSGSDFLLVVAACVLAAGILVSALVGPVLARTHRCKHSLGEADVARAFHAGTTVRFAALEAPGFLCLVTYMLSASPLALAGAAVALLLMLAQFPTRAGLDRLRSRLLEGGSGGPEPR